MVLKINGGILEGGGQILRIATALSSILQQPIEVFNIRANRPKPGLRPQHLLGIQLARDITSGKLSNCQVGSTSLVFTPQRSNSGGEYFGDTNTAGSITLLLQTLMPILIFGNEPTGLFLRGGTNVDMAPQIDFITMILKPLLNKLGIRFEINSMRRGYYPKGGGELNITIYPASQPLKPIELVDFGKLKQITGYSFVAGVLPISIANEMADSVKTRLCTIAVPSVVIDCVKERKSFGNGSGIVLAAETTTGCLLSGSALGSPKLPPGQVGEQAADQLLNELEIKSPVDCYTQDQLIIFMALAKGKSRILTGQLTLHTETAIHITELFTGVKFHIQPMENGLNLIECDGIGFVRS